jgi:hypothetical protein
MCDILEDCNGASVSDDCEILAEDETACDTCTCYKCCWGEFPWEAARAEYDRSRGV